MAKCGLVFLQSPFENLTAFWVRHVLKLGLYFIRPLADADFHAERRCYTAAANVFQRKLHCA